MNIKLIGGIQNGKSNNQQDSGHRDRRSKRTVLLPDQGQVRSI